MGASSSSPNASREFDNFYKIVDHIATQYILTMDFQSLSKLSEKAYCDKLVVLTSDIVDRYFNEVDVQFLAQRVRNGAPVNEMKSEKVRFVNRDSLDSLDVSNDAQKSIRKKRVCIGIAKFYVKVAHIFAAIVMTINPVYTYKDATGTTVKSSLLEKDKIPKGVRRKLFKLNVCDNRIRALKRVKSTDGTNVTLQPNICGATEQSLAQEPGMPELMRLYLDDKYDYSNGTFSGMSAETEAQFKRDLKTFYTSFTGNADMPATIQKFSDIKLRNYSKSPVCATPVTIAKKDDLFVQYANNIHTMIQRAADNQRKLLDVINDLFTYVIDPYTQKRVIRLHPELNETNLQQAVEKTRKYILQLYVQCENDYVTGVKLFEAIVESKIVETTQRQIETLQREAKQLIQQTKQATKAPAPVAPQVPVAPDASGNPAPSPVVPSPAVPSPAVPSPVVPSPVVPSPDASGISVPSPVVPSPDASGIPVPSPVVPSPAMPITSPVAPEVPGNPAPKVPGNPLPTPPSTDGQPTP